MVAGVNTQYIWIGGDAYTAVAVAKKVGTGSWTVCNIFRDHLGTITHLKNGTNPADEYSFDAWGRRRDKDDWTTTLTSEPALFADRGFTGHEYLEDFKLYNMNGRLYDPVVGRFLSPDPQIQDPGFTQSLNRYSYCLNNPLKYTDPSGELWGLLFAWLGNYAAGWLDNTINKGMSPKQAFGQTPIMLSGNYSPSANQFSNYQVDAWKLVKNDAAAQNTVGLLAGVRGQYWNEWHGVDAISGADILNWGEMVINTNVDSNAGLFDGHGWIGLESKKGEVITMSLWRQKSGKSEFFLNAEINKGYIAVVSKSTTITPHQYSLILNYNSNPSNIDWTPWNTCAGYSSGLWNFVTGENLSATDYFWFTTPRSLAGSINNKP